MRMPSVWAAAVFYFREFSFAAARKPEKLAKRGSPDFETQNTGGNLNENNNTDVK